MLRTQLIANERPGEVRTMVQVKVKCIAMKPVAAVTHAVVLHTSTMVGTHQQMNTSRLMRSCTHHQ